MVPSFFLTLLYFLFLWKCKVRCMSTPSDMSNATSACGEDWFSFENYCYKVESVQSYWGEASYFCKDLGGDLVSIHSQEEMDFITESILQRTTSKIWIGLHDLKNETTYEWSDGSAVDYVNWKPGEPSGARYGDEDCVEIVNNRDIQHRHGKWNDADCLDRNAFICKIGLKATNVSSGENNGGPGGAYSKNNSTRVTVEIPVCEDRWIPFGNYCYYVSGKYCSYTEGCNILSWSEASDFCTKSGAHLASIHSKQENVILADIFMGTSPTWIGLHDQGKKGNFEWSDGSTVDYENWIRGKPSGFHGNEACAVMVDSSGIWKDIPCWGKQHFLCQKLRIGTTPATKLAYQSREISDGSGNAAVTTITIVVICVVVLMIAVAGFIYFKKNSLAEKGQTLVGVIFKSSQSCKTDQNSSKDKIKLLEN